MSEWGLDHAGAWYVKGIKVRLSRKLVLIIGGIVVLGGGSGAAALYASSTGLLGPAYADINGLECKTVQTVKIKRDERYWVRKYVVASSTDGMERIRTAVRVAKAVQASEKADLVQIAVLDKAGPTDRAEMRGRAIGAQVIYTPDPSRVPEGVMNNPLSAFYLDGSADASGQYFGMRVDLPYEDIEATAAALTDKADCLDPVAAATEGGHGAPAAKGEKSGHGAGAAGGHGETPPADGHGASPAGGHDAPAADGHGVSEGDSADVVASTPEKPGFIASITGMFFGSKTEEAPGIDAGTTAAAETPPAEEKPKAH